MIITIDGPAGTGKTTIARRVAEKLGYAYFDTGAMYRAVTVLIKQKGINLQDQITLQSLLEKVNFEIQSVKGEKRYFIEGNDVTEVIRTPDVTRQVSEVSALPPVRKALVSIQRKFGEKKNSVFEGRDMGTVVFPSADVKIFLTARPAVRAERRYLELKGKHQDLKETEVLNEILQRDQLDSNREISPLKQADDAALIDTSDLTVDQVVEQILALILKKS